MVVVEGLSVVVVEGLSVVVVEGLSVVVVEGLSVVAVEESMAAVVQFDIYFVERMNLTWALIDLYKLESVKYVDVNSEI
jgi:hypothetical protein